MAWTPRLSGYALLPSLPLLRTDKKLGTWTWMSRLLAHALRPLLYLCFERLRSWGRGRWQAAEMVRDEQTQRTSNINRTLARSVAGSALFARIHRGYLRHVIGITRRLCWSTATPSCSPCTPYQRNSLCWDAIECDWATASSIPRYRAVCIGRLPVFHPSCPPPSL